MVGEPGNLESREIGNLGNTAGNKPFAPLELWPFFGVILEKHPHELETKGVDSAPQKLHRGSLAFPFKLPCCHDLRPSSDKRLTHPLRSAARRFFA